MIQYPLVQATLAKGETDHFVTDGTSGHAGHMRETASQRLLNCTAVSLASTDAYIAKMISYLYDGTDRDLELFNIQKMSADLKNTTALPLLGSEWIFYPTSEKFEMSTLRVRGVCSKNCFGGESFSDLYVAMSLLNHTHQPNTNRTAVDNIATATVKYHGLRTYACQPIQAGQEVTTSYIAETDPSKAAEKIKTWMGDEYGHSSLN